MSTSTATSDATLSKRQRPPAAVGRAPMPIPMVSKLAYRNLFHDLLSLFVTLVGIVFSTVLVAVQFGLYLGSEQRIAAIIDHTKSDLWVVPLGTKNFDEPSFLTGRERHVLLSTKGVASVEDLVVGFGSWKKPDGGATTIVIVGADTDGNTTSELPWDVIEGSVKELAAPGGVAVDKTYFQDMGIKSIGDTAEINNSQVRITAVTNGIRSFTTLPYIFTTLTRARALLDAPTEQASYYLINVAKEASVATVQAELKTKLKDAEVLTHDEFRTRSLDYWLFETGAGAALIAGAILGMIVGVVVVAQTLYASTKDHLNEFATLRALGASAGYIIQVILIQAVLSALMGYALGMALSLLLISLTEGTTLLIVMTQNLALLLFGLTVGMCVFAAISAIVKVIRIDPAVVFSR